MYKLKNTAKYLLLVIGLPIFAFSQSNLQHRMANFYAQIDSLKQHPNNLALNFNWGNFAKDSLLMYYQDICNTYEVIGVDFDDGQNIYWIYEKGILEISLGFYDKAVETFKLALNLIKITNKGVGKPKVLVLYYLSDAYRALGMVKESNDKLLYILQMPIVQSDSSLQFRIKIAVSENYEIMHDFEEAMELCIEQYNYNLRNEDYRLASYNLIQMGRIAAKFESDTSYFEYYHMANDLALKHGDSIRLSNNLVNIGTAYKQAGYPLMGLKCIKQAIPLSKNQRIYGKTYLLFALSAAYASVDSITKAIDIALKVKENTLKMNIVGLINHNNLMLSDYHKRLGHIDSAIIYLNYSIINSKGNNDTSSFEPSYKQLSDLSLMMNDYAMAMAYLDSAYMEKDKFERKINNQKLAELREKSDYYIHKNRIAELVAENKLKAEKSLRLSYTVIGIILILSLSMYFVIILRKRLQQIRTSYLLLVKKNIEHDQLDKQLQFCETNQRKKQQYNKISGEELILSALKRQLFEDEIYRDPNISLKSLADSLNTNTSYLSVIINSNYNCNFRTFINKYRIDKARVLLVSPEYRNYSIEGISLEVGFKSRTVFYQSFKNTTGLSPSLYIENYKIATSESS